MTSIPAVPWSPVDRPLRLAVLISGGGTTLTNLVEYIERGSLRAEVGLVIASRPDCGGVTKAANAGLRCEVIQRKSFASVEEFSAAIFDQCRAAKIDLVICGGFLALLQIPADYTLRVMNIHPSLIPSFAGKGYHGEKVHEAVINRGCKVSGCTVHFVDDQYDHGPIILQKTVPVLDDDTPDLLAARVFEQECFAYPDAITQFASGRMLVDGSRVLLGKKPH
jgi:phosphoribosylglycinamide formyltransferase 1